MAKKITAPKTYDPGKGRPKEHLAYLNEREMAYLRSINGNNMERGPRGLPSFPPDDSIGSSSRAGSSRGASGGSRGPGGPSGPNSSASGSRGPSQSKTSTTGGYRGPSSPMGGQGASFKSSSSAASYNKDVGLKNSLSNRDTSKAVKNSPAVRNDGVTGFKAQALGVKPVKSMSATKQPQPAPVKFGPANRDMEINRNLDKIKADFYNTDPDYQKALSKERAKVAQSRAGVGLLGAGISPRDTLSAPARTAPSTGMTQSEKDAIREAISPISNARKIAGGIADLYNDPVGTAARAGNYVNQKLDSFGRYAKDAWETIGATATSSDPDVWDAAAAKSAEIALNYGIMGSAGSIAGGVPRNSVGAFISPGVSPRADMQKAQSLAKDLWDKYGPTAKTPEEFQRLNRQIEEVTSRMVPSASTGVQRFGNRLGVEISEPWNLKVGKIEPGMKATDVYDLGDIKDIVPQVKDINIISTPSDLKRGGLGFFSEGPVEVPNPMYSGVLGGLREYKDMVAGAITGRPTAPRTIEIQGPVTSINSLSARKLGGLTPQALAGHEIGGHWAARMSEKSIPDFYGQNEVPGFGTKNFYGAKQGYPDPRYSSRHSGSPVGPEVYAESIMEKNPNMSYRNALSLGRQIYDNHIEESAANIIGGRSGMTTDQLRDQLITDQLMRKVELGRYSDYLRHKNRSLY